MVSFISTSIVLMQSIELLSGHIGPGRAPSVRSSETFWENFRLDTVAHSPRKTGPVEDSRERKWSAENATKKIPKWSAGNATKKKFPTVRGR